ncbi:MAG: helix-turn-helix transcriptional regulator [Clostridia bacterium]|nr:helix-turn-helix transcriptional regulator [Clostridia bacterium]MBO7342097.1 helix-turn-helix transcriptional regulator [Clostridia bacterium]
MTNTLKHHRTRKGLTQAELAARAGISLRTLQDYEQGRKPLAGAAASTVLKLADALGLCLLSDVEELIGEKE